MASLITIPSISLDLDSIGRILAGTAILVTGFIAAVRESGSRASLTYFGATGAIFLWLAGDAAGFAAPGAAAALWWDRNVTLLGVVFIPSLLVLFVIESTGFYRRLRALSWLLLGLSAVFYAAFSRTDWFISRVTPASWGYSPRFSPASISFVVFLAACLASAATLLASRLRTGVSRSDRRRSRLMLMGLGFAAFGMVDYLSAFGLPVYPAGYLGVAGLAVVAAYIIRRYRLTSIAPENVAQEIMRTMADGIVALDTHGMIRFATESASRIFGTPVAWQVGTRAGDIPGLSAITERLPHILEQGSDTFEAQIPGPQNRTLSVSASVVHGREHTPALVVFLARDMTQHMKDEAALRYERNLLRTLIDNLPGAVYVKDANYRKVIANPADMWWMRQFIPEGEVLGKTDLEIFPPDVAASFYEDDRTVIEKRTPVLDRVEYYRNAKGEERWAVTSKLPLFDEDGRVVGLLGTGRDITDQRREEQERERLLSVAVQERDRAEAQAAQLNAVFSSMTEGIILYGPGGSVIRANTVAESALPGVSFPSGLVVSEAGEPVTDDELPMSRALRGETVLDTIVGIMKPRPVAVRWLSVNAAPVADQKGQIAGAVLTFHDVTERKNAQKALLESEEQLRQAQKMEAVGRLAGGVAHDFNNLLTVINGYAELAISGMDEEDPHRVPLSQIQRSTERAANLTRKLLAFGRKQVLQPQVVNLNNLLDGLEKLLKPLIGEDIELEFLPDPTLCSTKVDPGQFEQVILNLAVNARDAMPNGGRLSIATRTTRLDDQYARHHHDVRPGRYAQVSVSDSGQGMNESTQARLFEPFFTTKEPGKGTGLGLAMVYGFVKQSEGHVEVHSEVGRGTVFHVYLPAVEQPGEPPAAVAAHRPPDAAEVPRGTETILLIEDEDPVRGLVRLMLQAKGYTVLEAGDGQEAIIVAQQYALPIHLLVTDVIMPRMGGREVADVLSRSRPRMRVLYMSGYTDEEVVRRGVPGTAFLQKPFTPAALGRKVREVLDGTSPA